MARYNTIFVPVSYLNIRSMPNQYIKPHTVARQDAWLRKAPLDTDDRHKLKRDEPMPSITIKTMEEVTKSVQTTLVMILLQT